MWYDGRSTSDNGKECRSKSTAPGFSWHLDWRVSNQKQTYDKSGKADGGELHGVGLKVCC